MQQAFYAQAADADSQLPIPPGFLDSWAQSFPLEDALNAIAHMRSEERVLSTDGLRAKAPHPLSFSDQLLDRMVLNHWTMSREVIDVGSDGSGYICYEIQAEGATFHFAVLSLPASGEERPGRLRDNEFDFLAILRDGPFDMGAVKRELDEARQFVWRGRANSSTIGWSFANRSARLFDYVVGALSKGDQPATEKVEASGSYLVRNAGFYGNGRHGTLSWKALPETHPLSYPYHADLVCLYLYRCASIDLVNAAARSSGPHATTLASDIANSIGIGNSSGIGTIAALVRWPTTLSATTFVSEFAVGYLKSRRAAPTREELECVRGEIAKHLDAYALVPRDDPRFFDAPEVVRSVLATIDSSIAAYLSDASSLSSQQLSWLQLLDDVEKLGSREALGCVESSIAKVASELTPVLSRFLNESMRKGLSIDPMASVGDVLRLLRSRLSWMLEIDLSSPGAREYFWYRSEENGENRRGVQAVDPGLEYATFVDVASSVQCLYDAAVKTPADRSVGQFLLEAPVHTMAVARAQLAAQYPYTELHANVVSDKFRPCDAIRYFLCALGMTAFTASSVQWVRGTFFRCAPFLGLRSSENEDGKELHG